MVKYIKIIAFLFLIVLIGLYWIVCDVSNNTVNIPSDIKLIINKSKNKNEFYTDSSEPAPRGPMATGPKIPRIPGVPQNLSSEKGSMHLQLRGAP